MNVYKNLKQLDKAAEFFLRSPAETSQNFVKYVEWTGQGQNLTYGCILDEVLTPPLPGDFISIMARPGHKKTTFMMSLAKRFARICNENEVVIYATWDETVEGLEGLLHSGWGQFDNSDVAWGRVNKQTAIEAGKHRIEHLDRLWVWGKSIMDYKRQKPLFTVNMLFNTIQALVYNHKVEVKAVFIDYLQIIPVEYEKNRTADVTAASKGAKELGKDVGCPVFAGVQASRETEKRGDRFPSWGDAQHASQIEQDSTKQLAIMNPIKYQPIGEVIEHETVEGKQLFIPITDNLMGCRILKQRGDRGRGLYYFNVSPNTLEIGDLR